MLLILEIILTIVSWKKGWRGWALLPLGTVLFIGFMVGAMAGAAGYSEVQVRQLTVGLLPLELISIGVLAWMAAKGRKGVPVAAQRVESKEMQIAVNKA